MVEDALEYHGRSPHGERGLKFGTASSKQLSQRCRSPHGERGLKYDLPSACPPSRQSLPARGAWIEIDSVDSTAWVTGSLPARGAWIEIISPLRKRCNIYCRSPHGERGLKFDDALTTHDVVSSLPARGAWIEMTRTLVISALLVRRRSPHGERGLKSHMDIISQVPAAVAPPRVERGLKSQCKQEVGSIVVSLRACAAWVETRYTIKTGIPPNSCTAGNVKVPCEPRLSAPTATRG